MNDEYKPPIDVNLEEEQDFNLREEDEGSTEIANQEEENSELEEFNGAVDSVLQDDFETARQNILGMLEKSDDAFDAIIRLAKVSDHPRAFEVVATMMKTMTDANKDLVELHKKKTEITGKNPQQQAEQITNNQYVFHGTPAELQQHMKERKKQLEKEKQEGEARQDED